MAETAEELRIRLANYETLLKATQERRQQALAQGNREIAGKIHQGEREWKRRIEEIKRKLAALEGGS
ncbi:MAG: hypothetical protein RMM58_09265 [Chloroflexota bacterium]|nr:hypothetical protein [Dehalococcoidia bacterium]MDW8254055.1 hypothetical protein [Chloroflexota bacterium]